ncbi:sensor histidine kinase [Nocardia sp. NBC_00508]|uniref:sensor histidine kinase n=1 Tax=Nocardia sp. NBC_00508 TaxID=2975992 RepID=UPI002E809635|nr:sensor histidine kinase [Nocardia sp. NBC_00508]WUD64701.1 sensor histidine kinase [Nocardia sp. NBC_00508]
MAATDERGTASLYWRSPAWRHLWDVYVVGGCATAILVVFFLDSHFPGNRIAASAALAAMVGWYAVFGRGLLEEREYGTRAALFVGGEAALLVAAEAFAPAAVAAQPIVYPLLFMALPLRASVALAFGVNLLPLALVLVLRGPGSDLLPPAAAITLVALLVSPLIGVAMIRAGRQSEVQARLLNELAASRNEASRLSHEAGIAAERARLAREIHDTLAQGLASIATLTQAVESELDTDLDAARHHIQLVGVTARENLIEARAMVVELTPATLEGETLLDSVRRQGARMAEETGVPVVVTARSTPPTLPTRTEVVLLRAVQEALTNVRKHGRATQVRIDLSEGSGTVRLSLSDNGIGFDDDAVPEGFGLRGMRRRVEQIGGTMSVHSRPGDGTSVEVEVPA